MPVFKSINQQLAEYATRLEAMYDRLESAAMLAVIERKQLAANSQPACSNGVCQATWKPVKRAS